MTVISVPADTTATRVSSLHRSIRRANTSNMCVKQATTVQLGLIQRRRLHVAKVSIVLLAHKPKLCVALGITRTRVVSQAANSAMLATTVMVKTRQQSKSVPAGTTAPLGTRYGNEYPCPAGYYGSGTGLTDVSGCTACTSGYYCQHAGSTEMSTKIVARYHANGIAAQTNPDPFLCPQLMYCPEGTETAIMCSNGKWTAWRGASSSTDCITCSRGKWCNFKDMESDSTFLSWFALHGDFTLA